MEFIIYNACLYMFGKFQKKSRRGWGFFWNPGIFRFEGGNCPSLPILLGVSWLLKFPLDLQNPKICQFSKCWWTFFYFWLLFLHACCMVVHIMAWKPCKIFKILLVCTAAICCLLPHAVVLSHLLQIFRLATVKFKTMLLDFLYLHNTY